MTLLSCSIDKNVWEDGNLKVKSKEFQRFKEWHSLVQSLNKRGANKRGGIL